MISALKTRLSASMTLSVALHAFALFGIALVMPDPRSAASFLQPLQVVLVNAKSQSRPAKADALAQANLDGGGNTPEDRQAKRSEEHTSELQSPKDLVCRLLLEK